MLHFISEKNTYDAILEILKRFPPISSKDVETIIYDLISKKLYTSSISLILYDDRFDIQKNLLQLLDVAIEVNNHQIVSIILEHPKVKNTPINDIIFSSAVTNNRLEIVKLLLTRKDLDIIIDNNIGIHIGISTNIITEYAIEFISTNNHIDMAILLIKYGKINPVHRNNIAIKCASLYEHIELVKLLLADNRVDPAVDNNLAILTASCRNNYKIVELLLNDPRVNPADKDNYAIKWACRSGCTEVVKLLLLDKRIDPTVEDNFSIKWASFYGHTQIVKLLIDDGRADPTAEDNFAIRYAIRNKHTLLVKLLLNNIHLL